MPRDDRVFSVLVACPSDVQEEARLVRGAVEEVDLGMASLQAARLEVVDWQTHATPGIGSDAQDVIKPTVAGRLRHLPRRDVGAIRDRNTQSRFRDGGGIR